MALANIYSLEQQSENCQEKYTILEKQQGSCEEKNDSLKQKIQQCSSNLSGYGSLQPTGNVVISFIRQVENAREIDSCIGMSTELGYVTSYQCCQADQMTLFDLDTYGEIPIGINSIWIEEYVCFINTTEIQPMNFPTFENDEAKSCSALAFDDSEGQFTEHQFEIEIEKCFNVPCPLKINPTLFQNGTILNGTSVVCNKANQIGIITKSKLDFNRLFYALS